MLRYAALWQLPAAFVQWLQESCLFVNSLVDRIVAGYPRTEAEQLCGQLGYRDNLLDCGELFHFFVLEGPQGLKSELPLAECGLNVVVTDRLEPYRTRKVRFLNGAHTADVPAALMGGLTYVDEMMNDQVFGRMVRSAVYDEIFPTVALPEKEKRFYADSVVERFLNPYAGHRLQSISLNSVSKWKVRVLPTLLDFLAARRELPPVLSFSLAALLRFYRVHPAGDGRLCGELGEVKWEVADSPAVVDFFAGIADLPSPEYGRRALANAAFWGMDLTGVAGLEQYVAEWLTAIDRLGVRSAVEEALRR